jgi:hypothetical protein
MLKIALCGVIIGVISLSAQDTTAVEKKLADDVVKKMAEAKAQLDGFKVMGASMINGPTVKGAPYSAEAVNEMVQTLADGNKITNTSSSMLYRDSQGRERREERMGRSVFITDPVEGVSYMLETNSKVARKTEPHQLMINRDGRGAGGGVGVAVGRGDVSAAMTENHVFVTSSSGTGPETFTFSSQEVSSGKLTPKVEHLGSQAIEGVMAEGTRTTVTIPAGQIGNEQPITTVSERWYSPELQVTVMTKRSDPRSGTTTYTLKNINRSEPSPTMFQVPPDYRINDMMGGPRERVVKEEQ